MEREDKQLEIALDSMLNRCQDLIKSLSSFIYRIDSEQLSYKDYVDAFASFQGHIFNLMKVIRTQNQPLSNRSVFPIKLSLEDDEGLTNATEGRLKSFNHDTAPIYLRTKFDPEIETRFNAITAKANSVNNDQAQKQITSANKIVQNMTELIRNHREECENELSRNAITSTFSTPDTYQLVAAMFNGKGLRPGQEAISTNKMNPANMQPTGVVSQAQRPAPIKAQPSIKTNIKAATSLHPYNR